MRKTNLKKNTQNKKDRIGLMGKITSEHSLSQGKCAIEMAAVLRALQTLIEGERRDPGDVSASA